MVRQAVGDRDPGPHEAALFDLQAKYAEVVDEDSVVSWLGTAAGKDQLTLLIFQTPIAAGHRHHRGRRGTGPGSPPARPGSGDDPADAPGQTMAMSMMPRSLARFPGGPAAPA